MIGDIVGGAQQIEEWRGALGYPLVLIRRHTWPLSVSDLLFVVLSRTVKDEWWGAIGWLIGFALTWAGRAVVALFVLWLLGVAIGMHGCPLHL